MHVCIWQNGKLQTCKSWIAETHAQTHKQTDTQSHTFVESKCRVEGKSKSHNTYTFNIQKSDFVR